MIRRMWSHLLGGRVRGRRAARGRRYFKRERARWVRRTGLRP